MGWFLRKPFGGHGPVRVNLSKTGLGVSAGVKGLRVGTGGRGTYLHSGRHGLYYRKQLGSKKRGRFVPEPQKEGRFGPGPGDAQQWSQSHATSDIDKVVSPQTRELVESINGRIKRFPIWPLTGGAFLILGIATGGALILLAILVALLTYWQVDLRRRTTTLNYELDEWGKERAQSLHRAVTDLGGSQVSRQVIHSRKESDRKRSAGADQTIQVHPISIGKKSPKYLKSNIPIPAIHCKDQSLYFLPDYLYVYKDKKYGVLPYGDLQVSAKPFVMIETSANPTDAEQVGSTWEKVNKDGSPDRRFSQNRKLPKFKYAELDISHPVGFRSHLIFSNVQLAVNAKEALNAVSPVPGRPGRTGNSRPTSPPTRFPTGATS